MLKILVWNFAKDKGCFADALKILERQHNGIELVGVTAAAETSLVYEDKNIPFIPLDEVGLIGGGYDVILVVGAKYPGTSRANMSGAIKTAAQLNLPEEKLLGDWIVTIPGFTLEKYRTLQNSRLSIFSVNCFGGNILNRLAMPFLSPFVNLYLPNRDFIKFLGKPHEYLEEKLVFKKTSTKGWPIVTLGDLTLEMMHYKTFEESVDAWERRKPLINWDNLFVVTWATSPAEFKLFEKLPYDKKVCFTMFKSDSDSAWYIDRNLLDKDTKLFVHVSMNFSMGKFFYYDWFDMLLYGKKTQLIDM